MFEYLLPFVFTRRYPETLLDGTCVTITDAFGTGWPLETTWPRIEALVSCATAGVANMAPAEMGTIKAAHERSSTDFFTEKLPRKQLGC